MGNFPAPDEQGRLTPVTRTTFHGRASREHCRDEGLPPQVILVTAHVRDGKRADMKKQPAVVLFCRRERAEFAAVLSGDGVWWSLASYAAGATFTSKARVSASVSWARGSPSRAKEMADRQSRSASSRVGVPPPLMCRAGTR